MSEDESQATTVDPLLLVTQIGQEVVDGREVRLSDLRRHILFKRTEDSDFQLNGKQDRILLAGESLFLVGRTPAGRAPFWEERPPRVTRVRHGVGNIRTSDGKDRFLVEGDETGVTILGVEENGVVYADVIDPTPKTPSEQTFDKNAFYDLRNHPSYLSAIGRIATSFAQMEHTMALLYGWMMQAPPPHSNAAYFALANNRARQDMITKMVPWLHDELERGFVQKSTELFREAAGIRNTYCHALWKKRGDKVYLVENIADTYPQGTKKKISEDDISQFAARVEKIGDTLNKIIPMLNARRPIHLSEGSIKPSFRPLIRPRRTSAPKSAATD